MKFKIKSCACIVCKRAKRAMRALDKQNTRRINKAIRNENKRVARSQGEYEINFNRFQGYLFD